MTDTPPTAESETSAPRATRQRTRRWTIAALIVALVLAIGTALLIKDPRPHFAERRSMLIGVERGTPVVEHGEMIEPVRLRASSGLTVELSVKRALADTGRRLPVMLVLGGHRTGRESVKLIGPTPGVIVAGMSYPYGGDPRPEVITFLRDIPKIRRAFLDTPPAAMLSLDYLTRLPEIDTTRIEAVGVSLGAPFVVATGALDKRISRVWAMHGSGGSYTALESAMRRSIKIGILRWPAAAISTVILDGPWLAPERWVGMIAPRPYVQVNTAEDERLPMGAIKSMYEAARPPKEMIWVPGRHIKADTAVIRPLVRLVLRRLQTEQSTATTSSARIDLSR